MIPTDIKNIDLSKHTVLAVDDIPMNLLLISKILSRLNITISTATNGREALEFIEKNKPSLVLLDLMLPGLSGEEILPHIQDIPVINLKQQYLILGLPSYDGIPELLKLVGLEIFRRGL